MKKLCSAALVVVAILGLGACQTVKKAVGPKEIDYRSARTVSPLEVPPDLTTATAAEDFGIPDTGAATYSDYAARARGAALARPGVLPQPRSARIERAGTQRWLVVQGSPEQLWPRIRSFWLQNGLLIAREDPATGIMETDWAENRADVHGGPIQRYLAKWLGSLYATGTRDKFRVRLEPGREPGTTEIYLSHRGMVERVSEFTGAEPVSTMWEPRPSDPELEAEMLRRLMIHLGVPEKRATALVAGTKNPAIPRARLRTAPDGHKVLGLDDDFDRAWRRVGLSLDRVGFTVEDRDRSQGIYFVRYVDPEADTGRRRGLFSRMFRRKRPVVETYQVYLQRAGSGTEVTVRNKNGSPERGPTGERILSLLYEQLK